MTTTLNSDKVGVCASALCAVHCLALPILLLIGADSIVQFAYTENVEKGLLFSTLLVAAIAFYHGYRQHKAHHVLVLFISGFLLLSIGESLVDSTQKIVIPAMGAGIIIYAHFQNHGLRKKACKC